MKRLLSTLLGVAMIMSLTTTAFAAPEPVVVTEITCSICNSKVLVDECHDLGSGLIDQGKTYQQAYNVGNIEGLSNDMHHVYHIYDSGDDRIAEALLNDSPICKTCLELQISAYEDSLEPAFDPQTPVTYTGTGTESYTVTVPASLTPGATGDVKVSGTWASNRKLSVTADSSVTMTNSIDKGTKTLAVTFAGINTTGNNETSITQSKAITVESIKNALFGTWTGSISYTVSMGAA